MEEHILEDKNRSTVSITANVEKDYRVHIEFSTWDVFMDRMKASCFNGIVLVKLTVGCGMLERQKYKVNLYFMGGMKNREKMMIIWG